MKVPLVDVTPPPEFGAVHADPSFGNPSGADFDHTYVPGFSDMRRARDTAIADLVKGKGKASEVPTLPVNLRWVRAQHTNGTPDNTKLWTAGQRGYVPVKPEDMGKDWLKALPLGAVKDANGMIRNGDTVLCVASATDAGRNLARNAAKTRSRMESAEEGFRSAVAKQAGAIKGVEPYVEATATTPSKKEK